MFELIDAADFPAPVRVRQNQETIEVRSAHEAVKWLMDERPGEGNASCHQARMACMRAIRGEECPSSARRIFEQAVSEADLLEP